MCKPEPADANPVQLNRRVEVEDRAKRKLFDGVSGYYITRDGWVFREDEEIWYSMLRFGDGKRLYISGMTDVDRRTCVQLVDRWEDWTKRGKPMLEPQPLPRFIAQQVGGLAGELTQSKEPWNELGGLRIHDNGSVECTMIKTIVSSIATGLLKPERVYNYAFTDEGRVSHDELVSRWEARQKKSDLDRVKEAVLAPHGCNWVEYFGKITLQNESKAIFVVYDAQSREMAEAAIRAYDVLHSPSGGNGKPE